MPKYNNSFRSPSYIEETIENENGMVGTIRIKPSSVLWKPKGAQKFFSVPLSRFTEWIQGQDAKASKTKS